MSSINTGKVALGGVVAGLIISTSEYVLYDMVVAAPQEALFERFGITPPGGAAIGLFTLISLALGVTTIWMYAALRSHSGPGPKTAACAAVVAWLLFYGLPAFQDSVLGMLPARMAMTVAVWSLVEMFVATMVGARLYSD